MGPNDPAFRIDGYLFYWVARVSGLYAWRLDAALRGVRADQARWRVLMILNEHSPASMGLIGDMAVMKLPTVVKLVQRMAAEGLIRAAPRRSDQRVMDVRILPAGRRTLRVIRREADCVFRLATRSLSDAQIERMTRTLKGLAGMLSAVTKATGRNRSIAAARVHSPGRRQRSRSARALDAAASLAGPEDAG